MSFRAVVYCLFFFFNDTATTEIYTLSLHDALPIYGKLLLKLSETSYLDSVLDYNTEYIYEINSIDADGLEGLNCPIIPVKTHEKVTKPILMVKSKINAIELDWTLVDPAINYKIYRNGNYMADTKNLNFIDNVQPGDEFCYTISAEDTFQTVGIQAEVQCIKAWFAPPANFKGTVNRNQISLSWTAVMGASLARFTERH